MNQLRSRSRTIQEELLFHAVVLAAAVGLMWTLELMDLLIWQGGLDRFGIRPRTWAGFRHIFVAPFLHAGLGHLIANTIPFVILGWFVMVRRTSEFFIVWIIAALVSGLGIWLLGGPNSIHIGASGVIFGFLGYLLGRGYYERSLVAIFLAVTAAFLYGGMLWGVLPGRPGVSWLGHLFGFGGGWLAAYLIAGRRDSYGSISTP